MNQNRSREKKERDKHVEFCPKSRNTVRVQQENDRTP